MGHWRYEHVRAMLAIPDKQIRSEYRRALRARGFAQVLETETADTVEHALSLDHTDLLITTPDLAGTDLGPLLQSHRHNRVGPNPFTVVVSMLDNPTDDRVRWAAGSGADDILQGNLPADQLMKRLDGFAKGRKPFIVTHDYIGPERRHVTSDSSEDLMHIEVPNPVQWRMMVNYDQQAFDRSVVATTARVNLHKVNRYAVHLDRMVEAVTSAWREGRWEPEGRRVVVELAQIAEDLGERISLTPFAKGGELVEAMVVLCKRMATPFREARKSEIAILPELTRYLGRTLGDEAITTASADHWRQGLREADFSLVLS